MSSSVGPDAGHGNRHLGGAAVLVLDSGGLVSHCSRAAGELLGLEPAEMCGKSADDVLASGDADRSGPIDWPSLAREGGERRAFMRCVTGGGCDVALQAVSLGGQELLLVLVPEQPQAVQQEIAFTRALFGQELVGVVFLDADLHIVRTNMAHRLFGGSHVRCGVRLGEVLAAGDARLLEERLRRVADTGAPMIRVDQTLRSPDPHAPGTAVSLSALRLETGAGPPYGVALVVADVSGEQKTRRRLALLHDAATRLGRSLDPWRTSQALADVLVPALGDVATVDLAEAALIGDEPPRHVGVLSGDTGGLRRTAAVGGTEPYPAEMLQPGQQCPRMPDIPEMRLLQRGDSLMTFSPEPSRDSLRDRPDLRRLFVPPGGHAVMSAPLHAGGLTLGIVAVWRVGQSPSFEEEDALILREIASRGALSVDNARRYTREHRAAVTLQRSLLPRASTDTAAAETAGAYLASGTEVGGDWFDVIPLSSLREAFVVGDVVGRGLRASATMGRLRTAVQTLADLDLSPDELLTHLDDQAQRFAAESGRPDAEGFSATCLYAVYDPVTRRCVVASAGHPPPAVVWPDGSADFIDLQPGPPLGVGSMPFEMTEVELPVGSVLALYTDGLVEAADRDPELGMTRLRSRLADTIRSGAPLQGAVAQLIEAPSTGLRAADDIATLLARVRGIGPHNVATWEFPADPAAVAAAREATIRQLAAWELEELSFTTELVVSELVTNAVRYAGGPVNLRLMRDSVLVCEVSDPSNTQPRMRRAQTTDEGGRGLFLVAQLTDRWGSRYGHTGKTIWTEQSRPTERPSATHSIAPEDASDPFAE